MKFIGNTRFSIYDPTSTSWRLSRSVGRSNDEAYRRKLYSEERMSSREDIFFNYSLPILDQAKGQHDLIHVVSYSEELPDRYQDELHAAEDRYDWLLLDRRTQANRKGTKLETLAKQYFCSGDIFAEFRLDDDDIVSKDYFESLAQYLHDPFVGYCVSHGLGIQAYYESGRFLAPRLEHRPKIAIGLARICKIDGKRIIAPGKAPHPMIDRECPVVVDSRSITFLHSLHLSQDSGEDKPDRDLANRFRNYLKQDPPGSNAYQSLFPGVRFGGDLSGSQKLKAVAKTHGNSHTLSSLLKKTLEYCRPLRIK